jgi:carbon-monoxide dehydrogenase medium subunit
MHPTTYHRPLTLKDAAAAYAAGDSAYVSGGHTLLPAIKQRLAAPENLIDLRHIPEMKGIRMDGGALSIGAATPHAEVSASTEVQSAIPALAGLAGSIGDPMVRHLGTIGGSVANNDPAADYPSALLALGATVFTDRRSLKADVFFTGLYATALDGGEIVTRIVFPVSASAGYAKFRNPASRYAMAAAFVAKFADGSVRVAVTGAGSRGVFRATAMEAALARNYLPAAIEGLTFEPGDMMSDIHGSAEYRAHLAKVMVRRAVQFSGEARIFK